MVINKNIIHQRFSKALKTYDQYAVVQKSIAEKLMQLTKNYMPDCTSNVFEIGCGTGFLTEFLLQDTKPDHLICNDLIDECQKHIDIIASNHNVNNVSYTMGDIETIKLPENLDVIISASAFQWLTSLNNSITKFSNALKEGGLLSFSTFGKDNFREIKSITGTGLKYYSIDEWKSMLSNKFDVLHCKEEHIQVHFERPELVLSHIKKTGVNCFEGSSWNKSDLMKFVNEYRYYKGSEGFSLTYNPIIIIAQNK
jgi:malonyl-CoA O-methyltransferase